MIRTVGDLRAALEDFDDSELVALAQQPSWPFEYSVGTVAFAEVDDGPGVVYIGEGEQVRYLPGTAAIELGWRSE